MLDDHTGLSGNCVCSMALQDATVPMDQADAPESSPHLARVRTIRDLIGRGDLEGAKAKLLAYAREAGASELEDEVILLSHRLASLMREHLQTGKDVTVERAQIARSLLTHLKEVEKLVRDRPANDAAPDRRGLRGGVAAAEPTQTVSEVHRSRLSKARKRFEAGQSPPPEPSDVVVECKGVGRRYKRSAAAFELSGVDLVLRSGQITGLIGENGAGKSTLLRVVAGQLAHTDGQLRYPLLGRQGTWRTIRPRIAFIEQQPTRWYGPVCETLHLSAAAAGHRGDANQREVDFWIYRLGLERYREALWSELSGGYKVRFELARALLTQPTLLILDEPLAALDVIAQSTFLQDLRDLTDDRSGPDSMLVSSQHLHEIELIADRLLFLRQGNVVFSGASEELKGRWSDHLTELTCDGPRSAVESALVELGALDVEFLAGRYLVRSSKELTPALLLNGLLARNVVVSFFHDISSSTRRLFERQGGL